MHLVKGHPRLIFSQYRHAGNCASLTDDLFEVIPFNLDPDHKQLHHSILRARNYMQYEIHFIENELEVEKATSCYITK